MFHLLPPPGYSYYYPSISQIGFCYPGYFSQFSTENTLKAPTDSDFMNNRYYQQQCQKIEQQELGLIPSTQKQKREQKQKQQCLQHKDYAKLYSVADNSLPLDTKNINLTEVNNVAILPDLEYILLPKEQLPAQEEASIEDMERLPKRHLLWTATEDNLLMKLRVQKNLRWREISFHFPNRSINSCQFRWKKLKLIKRMSKITGSKIVHKISKNATKYPEVKNLFSENLTKKNSKIYVKNLKTNNMISAGHISNIKLLLN